MHPQISETMDTASLAMWGPYNDLVVRWPDFHKQHGYSYFVSFKMILSTAHSICAGMLR